MDGKHAGSGFIFAMGVVGGLLAASLGYVAAKGLVDRFAFPEGGGAIPLLFAGCVLISVLTPMTARAMIAYNQDHLK